MGLSKTMVLLCFVSSWMCLSMAAMVAGGNNLQASEVTTSLIIVGISYVNKGLAPPTAAHRRDHRREMCDAAVMEVAASEAVLYRCVQKRQLSRFSSEAAERAYDMAARDLGPLARTNLPARILCPPHVAAGKPVPAPTCSSNSTVHVAAISRTTRCAATPSSNTAIRHPTPSSGPPRAALAALGGAMLRCGRRHIFRRGAQPSSVLCYPILEDDACLGQVTPTPGAQHAGSRRVHSWVPLLLRVRHAPPLIERWRIVATRVSHCYLGQCALYVAHGAPCFDMQATPLQPWVLPTDTTRQLLLLRCLLDESAIRVLGSSFFCIRRSHQQYSLETGMFFTRRQPTLSHRFARPVHPGARVFTPLRIPLTSRFVLLPQ